MFTFLYDVLFPRLGDVFGNLLYFSNLPWDEFLTLVNLGGDYTYLNLFTDIPTLGYFHVNVVFGAYCSALNIVIPDFVQSLPVWLCLIYCSTGVFLSYYVIKFVAGAII